MVETFKTECASRVAGGRRRRRLRRLGDGWHGRRLATVLERASLAKAASPSLAAP